MSLRTTCESVLIAAKRCTVRFVVATALVLFFCVQDGLTQQQLDREAVINHLNAVIKLYRNASAELQTGGAPSDVTYQDTEQSLTADVLKLAFQAAKAEAAAMQATIASLIAETLEPASRRRARWRSAAPVAEKVATE